MLIGEAAKEVGTTKKAIEYYEEQGAYKSGNLRKRIPQFF